MKKSPKDASFASLGLVFFSLFLFSLFFSLFLCFPFLAPVHAYKRRLQDCLLYRTLSSGGIIRMEASNPEVSAKNGELVFCNINIDSSGGDF